MDVLTFILEIMDSYGFIIVIMLSALLYLLLRRPIYNVIALSLGWRKRVVHTARDEKIVRRVRELLSSLGNANIEAISNEIKIIIAMGELAVEPLVEALRNNNPRIRWIAAKALGEIHSSESIVPLIRASTDRDSSVRLTITTILGSFNDRRIIEPLAVRLRDSDYFVRLAALAPFAQGKIKNSLAVTPIIAILDDKEAAARRDAARALGEVRDPRAVDPLIKLLDDPDRGVQEQVIRALGEIGDTRAAGALAGALSKSAISVRPHAARALVALGSKDALTPLRQAAALEENADIKDVLLEAADKIERGYRTHR